MNRPRPAARHEGYAGDPYGDCGNFTAARSAAPAADHELPYGLGFLPALPRFGGFDGGFDGATGSTRPSRVFTPSQLANWGR